MYLKAHRSQLEHVAGRKDDVLIRRYPLSVEPTIIDTFVESYDFSGKTLVPFATSGGSGLGKTVDVLKKVCPAANWNEGKLLNNMSDSELAAWANSI